MKRKIICLLTIFSILLSLGTVSINAASKTFTITLKDTTGAYLEGFTVSMRDSLSGRTNKTTDENGKATFTLQDGRTYGFNIYDANHNNACTFSSSTYTSATPYAGITYTLPSAASSYTTYTDPIELGNSSPYISSYYGYRYISSLDVHAGLDIAASPNTNIYSVADSDYYDHGTDLVGRGHWVMFEITSSRYVLYQHMASEFDMSNVDDPTEEGETIIGYVGNTGLTTGGTTGGHHLHIEFLTSSTKGDSNTVDPLRYIYK